MNPLAIRKLCKDQEIKGRPVKILKGVPALKNLSGGHTRRRKSLLSFILVKQTKVAMGMGMELLPQQKMVIILFHHL